MKLKLDMSCHLLNAYTKFQIDISKHVEKKSGKLGRTDGQTDGHCHSIIRPFFKRAYNKWWVIKQRSSQFQVHVCILWRTHDNFHNDLPNQKFHRSFWLMGSLKLVRLRQTVRVGACSTTGIKIIIENSCFADSTCTCILRVQVPVPNFSGLPIRKKF